MVVRDAPPALVALHREFHEDAANRGIPLHATVLFPFVPARDFDHESRRRLRRALGGQAPFVFELTRLERWPSVLWLAPEPDAPLRALTRAVAAEFPEHPPYEGVFDEVIPHVTISETSVEREPELRERVSPLLPLACRAREVTLLVEQESGRWTERERFPLGSGA